MSKLRFKSLNKKTSQHMFMDDLILSRIEYKKLDENMNHLHNDYLTMMQEMNQDDMKNTSPNSKF